MARIAGVDLPREKRVEIGLTYIYGIGRVSSNRILTEAGVKMPAWVKSPVNDKQKSIKNAEKLRKNQPKEVTQEAEEVAEPAETVAETSAPQETAAE